MNEAQRAARRLLVQPTPGDPMKDVSSTEKLTEVASDKMDKASGN